MTPPTSQVQTVELFLKRETRSLHWVMSKDEVLTEAGSYSELTADHSLKADEAFAAFEVWALENDVPPLSREEFDDAMDALGHPWVDTADGHVWYGRTRD